MSNKFSIQISIRIIYKESKKKQKKNKGKATDVHNLEELMHSVHPG